MGKLDGSIDQIAVFENFDIQDLGEVFFLGGFDTSDGQGAGEGTVIGDSDGALQMIAGLHIRLHEDGEVRSQSSPVDGDITGRVLVENNRGGSRYRWPGSGGWSTMEKEKKRCKEREKAVHGVGVGVSVGNGISVGRWEFQSEWAGVSVG